MEIQGSSINIAEELKEALKKWYGTFGPLLYISFEKCKRRGRRNRLTTYHPRQPLLCYFSKTDREKIFKDLERYLMYVTDGIRNYRVYLRDVSIVEVVSHQDVIQIIREANASAERRQKY
jgi:hypothetical protein